MTDVQAVVQACLPVATVIVGICVPVVTVKLTSYLGLKIDSAHQDALNAAIEEAIGKILHLGAMANTSSRPLPGAVAASSAMSGSSVTLGVASVQENARKAVRHFKLTDADITEKLDARWALLSHGATGGSKPWS